MEEHKVHKKYQHCCTAISTAARREVLYPRRILWCGKTWPYRSVGLTKLVLLPSPEAPKNSPLSSTITKQSRWHGEGYGILCQISNLFTFDRYTQGERYHTFSWTGYLVDSVLNGYRGRGWQEEEEERTVYRKRNHMRYQGQQGRRQPFVYKIISNSNILANIFYPDKMLNNNNLKKCETNRK